MYGKRSSVNCAMQSILTIIDLVFAGFLLTVGNNFCEFSELFVANCLIFAHTREMSVIKIGYLIYCMNIILYGNASTHTWHFIGFARHKTDMMMAMMR